MEIRHETPSPDMVFRVRAPLLIGFPDGETLRVTNWSLRGVYDARMALRDLSGAALAIPFQGVWVYFPVRFALGKAADEYLFDGLNGRQRETLALFYRGLLSGRMSSTDEIITSIDTPVDLVPMGETPAELRQAGVPAASRSLRAAGHVAVYLALAVAVFGYLAGLAWNRLTVIEVPVAHVATAPVAQGGTVVARLGADHALMLWAGMAATVRFNAEGSALSVPGRVTSVAADPASTGGDILLVIAPLEAAALPAPGTPVAVDLSRRTPPAT